MRNTAVGEFVRHARHWAIDVEMDYFALRNSVLTILGDGDLIDIDTTLWNFCVAQELYALMRSVGIDTYDDDNTLAKSILIRSLDLADQYENLEEEDFKSPHHEAAVKMYSYFAAVIEEANLV